MQHDARRRSDARIGVEIIRAAGAHRNGVRARALRELLPVFSIETNAEEMALDGARLAGVEEDAAAGFIHRGDSAHFPIAFGDLLHVAAVDRIEIEVLEAVAFAEPQELFPVLEKAR